MNDDRSPADDRGQDASGLAYIEDDRAMEAEERRAEEEAEQAVRD